MIEVFAAVVGLSVAALIVYLVRRDQLHVNHGLGWLLVAACFGLLGFAPGIFDWIATFLGISYPPVLALTIAIALLVIKALLTDIEYSKLKIRNQRLVQRLAILETELQGLDEKRDQPDQ